MKSSAVPDPGRVSDVAAVLLAGGRSSRMGTPKPALLFDGVPLITHLVRRLATVFPEIVVVRAPGQELPLPTNDQRPTTNDSTEPLVVVRRSSFVVVEDAV